MTIGTVRESADVARTVETRLDARGPLARSVGAWAAVFCAAMLLYFFSASRAIQWQDSGQFVLRIFTNDITDPIGLCCYHPLHFWLGRAALRVLPFSPPFALALVSALAGAAAVANVFGIVRSLTHKLGPALLAAGGLAVAHTFWRMSTTVEVYTISAALITAELWALANWDRTRHRYWLIAMMLANGIGFANHDLALLTLPVVGIVLLLAVIRCGVGFGTFIMAIAAWLIGASPYLWLIGREAAANGLGSAFHSALFGTVQGEVLGHVMRLTYTATSVAFTLLSFPNLTLPAAVVGIFGARQIGIPRLTYRALLAGMLIHLGFVLRYGVIDQYTFLLSAYAIIAIFAGLGYARAIEGGKRAWIGWLAAILIGLTPTVYLGGTTIARHFRVLGHWERHKPYRDDYRYLFIPWGRGEDSAARMSAQAAALARPNGLIIVEDQMGSFAVDYRLAAQRLPQVERVEQVSAEQIRLARAGGRPVVLVPSSTTKKPMEGPGFDWKRTGDLYELDSRQGE